MHGFFSVCCNHKVSQSFKFSQWETFQDGFRGAGNIRDMNLAEIWGQHGCVVNQNDETLRFLLRSQVLHLRMVMVLLILLMKALCQTLHEHFLI